MEVPTLVEVFTLAEVFTPKEVFTRVEAVCPAAYLLKEVSDPQECLCLSRTCGWMVGWVGGPPAHHATHPKGGCNSATWIVGWVGGWWDVDLGTVVERRTWHTV